MNELFYNLQKTRNVFYKFSFTIVFIIVLLIKIYYILTTNYLMWLYDFCLGLIIAKMTGIYEAIEVSVINVDIDYIWGYIDLTEHVDHKITATDYQEYQ